MQPTSSVVDTSRKLFEDKIKMAPVESILWILSFLWVFYQLLFTLDNQVITGWLFSIWVGFGLVRLTAKKKEKEMKCEDHAISTSSDEIFDSPATKAYDGDKESKVLNEFVIRHSTPTHLESVNRIYGANKTSFRANADDGLLCGVLLLPMVAASKLIDASKKEMDQYHIAYLSVRLELVLFMSVILLIQVFVNEYLHPLKRVIRKRGLFVSSICVAGLFTTLLSYSPLAPTLSKAPLTITIMSVTMFQWFLYICVVTLKKCFTLGEMCIISQAAAVVVHGAAEYICVSYYPDYMPFYMQFIETSCSTVLIHALVVGMIFIGVVTYPLLRQSRRLAQRPYWRSSTKLLQNKKVPVAITFYALTAVIVFFVIAPICQTITGENPFMWTLDFLYMSPSRMFLCLYWSLTVITTVVIWVLVLDFVPQSNQQDQPFYANTNAEGKALTSSLNKKRKLFHALAVIMFVPGLSFLQLAFGVALSAFIYLEYLRYFAIWPWGKSLHVFLTEFIDNRDLGPVILSHIYLLLGCASPVWLESSNVLASLSGILSLGFGDAAASIIGKRFGRYYWPGTKKTVEGTMAFIVAVWLSSWIIVYSAALLGIDDAARFVASAGRSEWSDYSFVITLTGLLEAFSTQNDNIVIPLYMYALVVLAHAV
ncbi:hypothetical protein CU098_011430 [Rhizopus stolonifer]|uniref:dolichol kinase n=1 Tax=Rhizopus stolonifer TaxID=4846 RepID=A0A367KVT8_RHIST|nr:hypothetical protein CU098_011430 [Rhizopus stolonifer]